MDTLYDSYPVIPVSILDYFISIRLFVFMYIIFFRVINLRRYIFFVHVTQQ